MKTPNWRVVTNRANAQHSTGPKTSGGKGNLVSECDQAFADLEAGSHSRRRSCRYDAHRADLVGALKPANAVESELVEELAANSWRLKRAHRVETAVLAEIAAGSPDPDMRRSPSPFSSGQRNSIGLSAT